MKVVISHKRPKVVMKSGDIVAMRYSSGGSGSGGGGEGVTSHAALSGLGADDHPQYHNDVRGDLRYYTKSQVDGLIAGSGSGVSDHGALTGLGDDDHPQYHNDVRGDLRYYTKSAADALLANKVTGSGTSSGTNTGDQTIVLSGDLSGSGTGSLAATIVAGAITLAKMANMATGSLFYRKTAGAGAPEIQTLATLKTDLGLSGNNTGDQTISLSGEATGSGTSGVAVTLSNAAVIGKVLTGFSAAAGSVTASDSLFSALQKIVGNMSGLVTGVSSVFGRSGAVVAQNGDYTTAQVTESGNLYYTNARAIAAVLTGYTSGAGVVAATDTILQAIQKLNGNDAQKAPLDSPVFVNKVKIPNLTTSQRNALPSPGMGDFVYDTNLNVLFYRSDYQWVAIPQTITPANYFDPANIRLAEAGIFGVNVVTLRASGMASDINVDLPSVAGKIALEPRVVALTDASTIAINCDTTDIGTLATLSQSSTIGNPSGTPRNMQPLMVYITSASPQALAHGSSYIGSADTPLPTITTGGGKTDVLGYRYYTALGKWMYVAKNFGF